MLDIVNPVPEQIARYAIQCVYHTDGIHNGIVLFHGVLCGHCALPLDMGETYQILWYKDMNYNEIVFGMSFNLVLCPECDFFNYQAELWEPERLARKQRKKALEIMDSVCSEVGI